MTRLPRSLLIKAGNISALLPILLRTCRTLPSARNELRWLRQHVIEHSGGLDLGSRESGALLHQLCLQRGRGVPLQYLLGCQPFGELEILCRRGVLIPRPETEAYTNHLATVVENSPHFESGGKLQVLDLCTGTGCIPLLLFALLHRKFPDIQLAGIDVSSSALKLTTDNVRHNIYQGNLVENALDQISFLKANVLSDNLISNLPSPCYDIVISNPPYISQKGFNSDTSRSVRNWEPREALVPRSVNSAASTQLEEEDVFYPAILSASYKVGAKLVLMEVAGTEQALRVARFALDQSLWASVEIWRDYPSIESEDEGIEHAATVGTHQVHFKGSGHGRSVLCRR